MILETYKQLLERAEKGTTVVGEYEGKTVEGRLKSKSYDYYPGGVLEFYYETSDRYLGGVACAGKDSETPRNWSGCVITNLRTLQPKTLENLEVGDFVEDGNERRMVLGICGKVYILSYGGVFNVFDAVYTVHELQKLGYKPVQPEEVEKERPTTDFEKHLRFKLKQLTWSDKEIKDLIDSVYQLFNEEE